MKFRSALFMLFAITVLFALKSLVLDPKEEAAELGAFVFPKLSGKEIKRIEVTRGSEAFTLENDKGTDVYAQWSMKGKDGGVDAAALRRLVVSLSELKAESPVPKEEVAASPADFGLDKPEAVLAVVTKDSEKKIEFGLLNEMVGKRYARVTPPNETYAWTGEAFGALAQGSADFRNRLPLQLIFSEVKSFTYSSREGKLVLEQVSPQTWRITTPIQARASTPAVEDFLKEISTLKAERFLDGKSEHVSSTKLASPEVSATLNLASGDERTIDFSSAAEGGVYFTTSDLDIVFYDKLKGAAQQLKRSLEDFREKKYFVFNVEGVRSAEFATRSGSKLSLHMEGTEWKVNGKPGDAPFIKETLRKLARITAIGHPPVGAQNFGFDNPEVTIVVREILSDGQTKESKLVIGTRSPTGDYYAATDDLSEAFRISAQTIEDLVPAEEKLLPVTKRNE